MIEVLLFGLSKNQGGIETYLRKIWTNIDHSNFHFNFLDMTGEDNLPCFYDELVASGCNFYKITPRSVSVSRNKKELKKLFKEHSFDILHYNVNTLSYVLPIYIALKAGCKVLVHSRNAGAGPKLYTKFFHYLNKIRVSNSKITRIAVSSEAGKWLFGKTYYTVYHNGLDTKKYTFSETNRKKIRDEFSCHNKFVIGNVAAFLPAKNQQFMITTFPEIKKRIPEAELWFVGDGPLKNDAIDCAKKYGVEESVSFLGVRDDISNLYAGMDFFWFPSLFEGFGNVLLEAQCSGLPCLISDCIPQDALITENSGKLSLDCTAEQWADKIVEMIGSSNKSRVDAYKIIEEHGFSVQDEIIRIEELYKSMLRQ